MNIEFEKKMEQETASTAFQLVWGLIKRTGLIGYEKIKIENAMKIYAKNYQERYGKVKPLGKAEPIDLYHIYLSVHVVSSSYLTRFVDKDEMQKDFIESGRLFKTEKRIDGIDAANKYKFLNILGAPGAGKTTFIRRLGLDALFPGKLVISNDFFSNLKKFNFPDHFIQKLILELSGKIFDNLDDIYRKIKKNYNSEVIELHKKYNQIQIKRILSTIKNLENSLEKTYDDYQKRQISQNISRLKNQLERIKDVDRGDSYDFEPFVQNYVEIIENSNKEQLGGFKRKYIHNKFPVVIEIRKFSNSNINLVEYISKELSICAFPESISFVESALKKGSLLVLFDGLDEVKDDKLSYTIDEIQDFVDRYNLNRYVVTCRTAAYKNYFDKFIDVTLADLTDRQIKEFAGSWFSSTIDIENDVADKFFSELSNPMHISIKELCRTPLLLTFLCIAYDRTQAFPLNRSKLYQKALLILLEEWAAKKRVHDKPIHPEIHSELEIEMLSEIAFTAFENENYLFNQKELCNSIKHFMSMVLDAPISLNSKKILDNIEIQQGIIVQRGLDLYSFSHLTVQEFLTAYYINIEDKLFELSKHIFEPRWREIFILLSGLHKADRLIKLLSQEATKMLFQSNKLVKVINQLANISRKRGDNIETKVIRFLICFYIVLSIELEPPKMRLLKYSLDCIQDIIRCLDTKEQFMQIFKEAQTLFQTRSYAKGRDLHLVKSLIDSIVKRHFLTINFGNVRKAIDKIFSTNQKSLNYSVAKRECNNLIYNAFKLDQEWLDLSDKDIHNISEFAYVFKLIVDCRISSYRLSSSIWIDSLKNLMEST